MRFHVSMRSSALIAIILVVLTFRSQAQSQDDDDVIPIPIASALHYEDTECSKLSTASDFHGYYQDPDAEDGTPEATYTYFCDPAKLSSYASYGIYSRSSCYVDNGGNWYSQPLGLCAVFVKGNETFAVKFSSINVTNHTSYHQVFSDIHCTVPKTAHETLKSNVCQKSIFVGSYQIIVSGAYFLAKKTAGIEAGNLSSGNSYADYRSPNNAITSLLLLLLSLLAL